MHDVQSPSDRPRGGTRRGVRRGRAGSHRYRFGRCGLRDRERRHRAHSRLREGHRQGRRHFYPLTPRWGAEVQALLKALDGLNGDRGIDTIADYGKKFSAMKNCSRPADLRRRRARRLAPAAHLQSRPGPLLPVRGARAGQVREGRADQRRLRGPHNRRHRLGHPRQRIAVVPERQVSVRPDPRSIASVSSPRRLDFYDTELRALHEHLRAVHRISPGDDVLDIGCGTGLTTREAARAAAPGRVVGVDVSERMLERARQLTAAEGLANVRYELDDAQVHRFGSASFDVAISRFGTMFFSDPAAAFANLATALRPGARLVLLVWQRYQDNEWARAIDDALGDTAQPAQPGADPFSLGDAETTAAILEGAGFEGMHFADVHEPVLYGHDLDAALAFLLGFQSTSAALATLSRDEAARTVERLRKMLAAHHSDGRGVILDSRAWLITGRRRR